MLVNCFRKDTMTVLVCLDQVQGGEGVFCLEIKWGKVTQLSQCQNVHFRHWFDSPVTTTVTVSY